MKQYQTSPRWQYLATGIFAILAMISGFSALQKPGTFDLQAQTMSVPQAITNDNGHSETFQLIEERKNGQAY